MQKTSLSSIVLEELTRAFVFWVSFFTVLSVGFVSVAYAANGGVFGTLLNQILASGNWEAPGDGRVKNSDKLAGVDAINYVRIKAGQSCASNKCITGFQADGTVNCTP